MKIVTLEIENDEFADALLRMLEQMHFVKIFLENQQPTKMITNSDSINNNRELFYGKYKDKIRLTSGFDEPLDDFQEYMK